jgi:hypothetical protein
MTDREYDADAETPDAETARVDVPTDFVAFGAQPLETKWLQEGATGPVIASDKKVEDGE